MTFSKILIRNAKVVNDNQIFDFDLLIHGNRIEKIATKISSSSEMEVFDAEGKYIIPGLIDDQVHFREPGLTLQRPVLRQSQRQH
jgi:dihydroorotase